MTLERMVAVDMYELEDAIKNHFDLEYFDILRMFFEEASNDSYQSLCIDEGSVQAAYRSVENYKAWGFDAERTVNAAMQGYGKVTIELRWAERFGSAHCPSLRVQKYTEKILDEELARDTGYYIVKKSENDDHYARYEVWWYSEEYDAYKVEREATINGIEEEEDYPLPSLS